MSSSTHDRPEQTASTGRLTNLFSTRFAGQPAWAAVTEVFIGLGWLRAAASKVIDPSWWSGVSLTRFLSDHSDLTLGWYAPFVDAVIANNTWLVALAVLVLQLVVAVSLLAGWGRPVGLGFGIALNLHFVAAGAVNPSAFYLLAQGALLLWLIDSWSARQARALLPAVAASGLAVAGFNVPFIRTLHPADVIDDPAIMLVMLGAMTCLACLITISAAEEMSDGSAKPSDQRKLEAHPGATQG